ncbi:hypothetical protein VITU102760_19385 [Vibrio tubiashii]
MSVATLKSDHQIGHITESNQPHIVGDDERD